MGTSLLTLQYPGYAAALAALKRLRGRLFNLIQTSAASGLAWYLAHDVLGHPQPFFAPIASAVCLSISNVLRAQRAVQMMIGVTLGIGIGTGIQGLLGPGAAPIAIATLIALSLAVSIGQGFIGQGMMFANQTVVSSILVLALPRSRGRRGRLYDALIGGSLAIVFAVLLFPADPLKVLRAARIGVLRVLQAVLSRTAELAAGRRVPPPDWPLSAVDRVHEQLGGLMQAPPTARQALRISPRRGGMRDSVRAADHQAIHVALLAGSVLELARAVAPVVDGRCHQLPEPVHAVLVQLGAATALADSDPAGTAAYIAAARGLVSKLHADARERT